MIFWHCTPTRLLDSILREGLRPEMSNSSLRAVFLSGHESTALNYACMKDEPCSLLEIDLPEEALSKLAPDNYELPDLIESLSQKDLGALGFSHAPKWSELTWAQSLEVCDQVACHATIPSECIRVSEKRSVRDRQA